MPPPSHLPYQYHSPTQQDFQSPPMNPHYDDRSPSPGRPLQGYQLEDVPQGHPQRLPLQMPFLQVGSHDRLAEQPSYSVEHLDHQYDPRPAPPYGHNYASQDYAISPEEHHDAYYQAPYLPHPNEGHQLDHYPPYEEHPASPYHEDNDQQPILNPDNAHGPDPESQQYQDHPQPTPSQGPIRRWKTVKEVKLFQGNLVLDCPVPPRLLNQVPHAAPPERDEFTHMRYTAATCDPEDFYEERFTLRQRLFAKPRDTELFIVVTMYNEDDFLFTRTMMGVFKNIDFMCSKTSSKTWGKEAWKKIVVCVVSDGRAKINPRTRAVLAGLGVYQDGIAKQQVNGKNVTAHLYEYTTQIGLDMKGSVTQFKPRSGVPVQMLFCLKEKNQKKINSHRWFFQAFGRVLTPNICVLIDAGTKPGKDSIYHLWKAFDLEPMCGGACGEIKAMLSHGKKLLNPLIAGQNFEYKMSNILDKPFESVFGFISVLPGAFSAYRYVALQNDKKGDGPLQKYFLGEKMHGANAGIFTANMYLAEDRILCFELVSKRNCQWILQYVKSATGETDVPDHMADFILQRRRWLNGSFFAAVYALGHFYQIWRSDHGAFRKFAFLLEFTYQLINMLFAWFAIGNFFLVFRILTASLSDPKLLGNVGNILSVVFEWLYLATLLTTFVLALGNRPKGSNKFYMGIVYFWVIIMIYLIFALVYVTVISIKEEVDTANGFRIADLIKNTAFLNLIVSLGSTYVIWFVASFLFFDPWHMFTSFIQYTLLTPTYINVLNIYAFCNTHDITWGTREEVAVELPKVDLKPGGKVDVNVPQDDGDLNAQYEAELTKIAAKATKTKDVISEADHQQDYYKGFRSSVVLFWIFCNFALAAAVLNAAGLERVDVNKGGDNRTTLYLAIILWTVAALSLFRFLGAVWFLIVRMFRGV